MPVQVRSYTPKTIKNPKRVGDVGMIDIGTTLADGSLYAGHHPVDEGFLVCKAEHEPELMTWYDANKLSDGFFRLPTPIELNLLFWYRNKICVLDPSRRYWSSKEGDYNRAWVFPDTVSNWSISSFKDTLNSVRLVRTVRHSELKNLIREIWW